MDKNQTLRLLEEFISIQSVSTDKKRYSQILKAADFLEEKLKRLQFTVSRLQIGEEPPLIIAHLQVNPRAKTIGIYGHYDVQPEDPVNKWDSDPFKLTLRNGKLYARGVADNKGHIIQNITALEALIKEKKLRNNIVCIFEGEEEIGSVTFEKLILQEKSLLSKVDAFFITDTGMYKKNVPQIFYGLRGLVYFELTISIGKRDLHSGVYGNRVYNPVQVLASLFSKMKDVKTNKVLIPHFYDDVRKIDLKEMDVLKKISRSREEEIAEAGVQTIISIDDISPSLVTKIMPSFDINGIYGGFIQEGSKTIIPASVTAKFSTRLVENQTPDSIIKLVSQFVQQKMPIGIRYELKVLGSDFPFYTSIDNEYIKKTARILTDHFHNETPFNRSGGTIPAAEILQSLFKKPIILTGFTLPDDRIHSFNENFDEEMFWKGIEALKKIYSQAV